MEPEQQQPEHQEPQHQEPEYQGPEYQEPEQDEPESVEFEVSDVIPINPNLEWWKRIIDYVWDSKKFDIMEELITERPEAARAA